LARHQRRFGDEHFAADLGPGEPGRDADLVRLFRHRVAEARNAEILRHLLGRDLLAELRSFDDDLARHLAADRRELALEVADARLARVALDDRLDRFVSEGDVLLREPGPFDRLRGEELLRDLELLELRVAREL